MKEEVKDLAKKADEVPEPLTEDEEKAKDNKVIDDLVNQRELATHEK